MTDRPTKHWRSATRDAMYKATLEEAERRSGSEQPVFNYRWEHVQAVQALALKLSDLTGADSEIVEAAVWLHDIAKETGEEHAQEGAAFARTFLPQTDFPPDKIESVARAIEEHKGLWRETPLENLEAQVLWDADKLAKLGLTAAFHWTGMALMDNTPVTIQGLIAKRHQTEWQTKTVASMHTAPARRAAAHRLQAFNQLWDRLEAELDGADLEE